jgi:hypothetical protein
VSELDLLAELLQSEHEVVYGYGVLGARLDDATRRVALAAYDVHRARRDALAAQLRARGDPQPSLPAYDVAVADAAEAHALAVRLEEGMALRWRDLVAGTDDVGLRRLALSGLQETAVRAATWRRLTGAGPVTVALPGTDERRRSAGPPLSAGS